MTDKSARAAALARWHGTSMSASAKSDFARTGSNVGASKGGNARANEAGTKGMANIGSKGGKAK